MKLKFDQNLPHQKAAWEAVVALFTGQENCFTPFTMPQVQSSHNGTLFDEYLYSEPQGVANRLLLSRDELLSNLNQVQLKNGLKPSKELDKSDLHYTVEMETGTGKTYVYLRSIYELNQAYGLTKFIIVVPNVAIREGVKKSIEITRNHFSDIYKETKVSAFVYDSDDLGMVRSFAESSHIQIMVINIAAFNKSFSQKELSVNIIHRQNDRLDGVKPIELIAATNPVVIIDEPQTVDTTDRSTEAIRSLNPIFTLRFSATHRDKHLPIYKLDAVDAYNQKLVKEIAVLEVLPEHDNNAAYIRFLAVRNTKGAVEAQLEYDAITGTGAIKRDKKWLKQGADLYELTKRDLYEGYIIKDISAEPENEWIDFSSRPDILSLGQSIGGSNELELKRVQIKKTIETHLNRELALNPMGIKVLSLFFIDKVANYRVYDEEGKASLGPYGQMFEEEYLKLAKHPKYQPLFKGIDLETSLSAIHDGYFAADNKGVIKDTSGQTLSDASAYDLIMKDKERLLSMKTPLRFIFSHSALREGWDNPNVFQICTLNETASTIKKRQEIGRGLRLAVNQNGERVTDSGFTVNTLTVIANESYAEFTSALQKEIEEEEGIRFGVVEPHTFASLTVPNDEGELSYLGVASSEQLYQYLKEQSYINNTGKVQDQLKVALKQNKLVLPDEYANAKPAIENILKKIAGGLDVKNARQECASNPRKEVILGPDFKALWDRIKYKTIYQVSFNLDKLVNDCVEEMKLMVIPKARFNIVTANLIIDQSGVDVKQIKRETELLDRDYQHLPDVLSYLQNKTQLTRKTLARILIESGRLNDLKKNPQKFIENTLQIIQRKKRHALVDGIKYEKIGEHEFYAQELFLKQELIGYLNQNMLEVSKSIYDHIVYDSEIESEFAKGLEQEATVKLYSKLPSWFKIDTPLGSYNPDWAILVDDDAEKRLYFVVETKGSLFSEDLRLSERDKITCGEAHFAALDSGITYKVAASIADLT